MGKKRRKLLTETEWAENRTVAKDGSVGETEDTSTEMVHGATEEKISKKWIEPQRPVDQ